MQILGAEKALFRALKTRSNTPKYGLIFNASYIGRAKTKDKGRISRYLANKCSIASRLDAFSGIFSIQLLAFVSVLVPRLIFVPDKPTDKFGVCLAQQVEDRLKFFETGVAPAKNVDVMHGVLSALQDEDSEEILEEPVVEEMAVETPKKEKKEKKEKRKSKGSDKKEKKKRHSKG